MPRSRLPLLACALLAACSTPATVPQVERFDPQSPFQHFFAATPEATCEAARRALLSQGYVIDPVKPDNLQATKYFQPDSDHSTTLQISLVCVQAGAGAGVSLAGLGSLSLPWGGNNENLVKVGEATIADPDFYTRFFSLMKFEFLD